MSLDDHFETARRLAAYLDEVAKVVGHADRMRPLRAYCAGLLVTAGRRNAEVMAAVRAAPNEWTFAVATLSAAGHLAMIEFVRRLGVNVTMTSYRGTAPALTDVMPKSWPPSHFGVLLKPLTSTLERALFGSITKRFPERPPGT